VTTQGLYINYCCYQITVPVNTFLYKSGLMRSVRLDIITGARAGRLLVEYVTLDKTFYNLLYEQEVVAAPSYLRIFFLIPFLEETYIRNIILLLCINYIVIICINSKAVINNNLWKTRRPYFSLPNSHRQARGFLRNL